MDEADTIPLTLAIALKEAGNIFVGAFDTNKPDKRGQGASAKDRDKHNDKEKARSDISGRDSDGAGKHDEKMVGFAFGFLGREHGETAIHSHMLAVLESYRHLDLGKRLKLAQRERALAMGVREMTWTFDPLQSRNAHFNFAKLGVLSDAYKVDFYGPETSSVLHRNGTDRLWVRWLLDSRRVRDRIASAVVTPNPRALADKTRVSGNEPQATRGVRADEDPQWDGDLGGSEDSRGASKDGRENSDPRVSKDPRGEALDALRLLAPVVRFDGNGRPAPSDLDEALARERVSIEIPGNILAVEQADMGLARAWRESTRWAFRESLKAGFVVAEYCRSIRGRQGPGAYLLVRGNIAEFKDRL